MKLRDLFVFVAGFWNVGKQENYRRITRKTVIEANLRMRTRRVIGKVDVYQAYGLQRPNRFAMAQAGSRALILQNRR